VFTTWNGEFESDGNSRIPGVEKNQKFALKSTTSVLPSLHVTHSFPGGISVGLSGYSMWGQKTEWPEDWEGRFAPGGLEAEIGSYRAQAVIAYAPSDVISVAGGIFHDWLDLSMRQKVWAQMLTTEFDYAVEGTANGIGWISGILFRPTDSLSFGATYRSSVRHQFDSLDIEISPDIPFLGIEDTKGTLNFTTPAIFNIGSAFKWKKWTISFETTWTEWSSQDVLHIKFDQTVFGNTDSKLRKDWKDSWTYGVGIEYEYSDMLRFRAGYIYDESPVPSDTLDPMVFSGDSQLFCLGLGLEKNDFKCDVSCSRLMSAGRSFDNEAGDYPNPGGQRIVGEFKDSSCDIFVLNFSYRF
jgi:long-chain fatty acid transport protein